MTQVSPYVRGWRGLSQQVIDFDPRPAEAVAPLVAGGDGGPGPAAAGALRGVAGALAGLWPAGLAPVPAPEPDPDPAAVLPQADYVVITWTAADYRRCPTC